MKKKKKLMRMQQKNICLRMKSHVKKIKRNCFSNKIVGEWNGVNNRVVTAKRVLKDD